MMKLDDGGVALADICDDDVNYTQLFSPRADSLFSSR